jgi:hypothetical protein
MTSSASPPLVVGVLGDPVDRLSEAFDGCDVHVRAVPEESLLEDGELLRCSDVVVLRLAGELHAWSLLVGALRGLAAGDLMSVYVLADDVAAVEALLAATSRWGEEAATVRASREAGRLCIVHVDEFAPADLRGRLVGLCSNGSNGSNGSVQTDC